MENLYYTQNVDYSTGIRVIEQTGLSANIANSVSDHFEKGPPNGIWGNKLTKSLIFRGEKDNTGILMY